MVTRIKVGTASCGIAAGAGEVLQLLRKTAEQHGTLSDVPIVEVGCIGHCYAEPLVEVETDSGRYFYEKVEPKQDQLRRILNLEEQGRFRPNEARAQKERTSIMALAGRIEPTSLEEYRGHGGYEALAAAHEMAPEKLVEEVKESRLRGRGGGGFPTGLKWRFLAGKESDNKVLICNADEGDPGAFMDRTLMESLPHLVLEGMLIGAKATGARRLFIYCRAEYPRAVKNLNTAIEQIRAAELNVIDGHAVDIRVKEGAGAFVCGEETGLIHSLEGRRGTPRYRPPYPTDYGFHGAPTAINNVETFANIPQIVRYGASAFTKTGTENSTGTKLFALAGDLQYSGLVEVPMGLSIGEVVFDIGGAERGGVKAVQIGGPSGGCIPAEHFDTPIDYDSLSSLGAIMGSGGLIVIGTNRCMVETARYFLEFTTRESCGKCTFCRVGTKRMLETLERITGGEGSAADIERLGDLGTKIKQGSLCGLGQTAPNPVLSTLRYFNDEYQSHVEEGFCPALECKALVDIFIDPDQCNGCKLCIKACPVNCISEDFVVDNAVCTRCNSCIEVCRQNAISRVAKGGAVRVAS